MIAPAATPAAVIATLNHAAKEAMADPTVKDKLADQGLTLAPDSPEEFHSFIEAEAVKWAKVIKDAGVETTK
jgi:tripartite-type tricarboxylate transporter receptor subunit TctC